MYIAYKARIWVVFVIWLFFSYYPTLEPKGLFFFTSKSWNTFRSLTKLWKDFELGVLYGMGNPEVAQPGYWLLRKITGLNLEGNSHGH